MKVLVIHGPNLNLLGDREVETYGKLSLADIDQRLKALAGELKVELATYQSNVEGEIVNAIQAAKGKYDALIINPGGYTHSSVAIRDAITAVKVPTVEVHLSNVHAREPFRHHSHFSDRAIGTIVGLGVQGYEFAVAYGLARLTG